MPTSRNHLLERPSDAPLRPVRMGSHPCFDIIDVYPYFQVQINKCKGLELVKADKELASKIREQPATTTYHFRITYNNRDTLSVNRCGKTL